MLDTQRLSPRTTITLRGDFTLDAISPDGNLLYLIETTSPDGLCALRRPRLRRRRSAGWSRDAIVDPEEADEPMRGSPLARAMSLDGRWAYTLYDGNGGHPFIHALDTVDASAKCIDLDQLTGDDDLFALRLAVEPDGGTVERARSTPTTCASADARPQVDAASTGRGHTGGAATADGGGESSSTPAGRLTGLTPFAITYACMSPRDWNATSYERVSAPLEAMGRDVLDRLELRGDERVLDAGCGTGRVTAALVERLPRGEVVAVDGSPAMVEQARERLGDRVDVRVADLVELELERPVDAILSTATFHWIADHERLFARLLGVLVPGGRLVAQCGGAGNVAALDGRGPPRRRARAVRARAGGLARAVELRLAGRDRGAAAAARLGRRVDVVVRRPRGARRPARVPRHGRARLAHRAPGAGAAHAVRGRRDRRAGRAGRGLRAAQHPR